MIFQGTLLSLHCRCVSSEGSLIANRLCIMCASFTVSLLLEWVKRDVNICICTLHLTHCHTSYSNTISSLVSGLTLSAYTLTYVVGECGLDWGREWEMPPWAAMRCSFRTLPQYWSLPLMYIQRHHITHGIKIAIVTIVSTMTAIQPRFCPVWCVGESGMVMSG